MGLILPQTIRVRTSGRMCKYYRQKGYEFEKCGDFIEVNVLDLPKGSGAKVKIICDVCGKKSEMCYGDVVKHNEENELITCTSNSCADKKRKDTCMKKYGANNPSKVQEIKDKKKNTCQIHFGVDSPLRSKEIQNKAKKTWQLHFGVDNPFGSKEIQDKSKKTLQKRYNVDNPSKAQEIKDKKKNTCQIHLGVDNPFESKEIQDKIKDTWKKNYGVNNPMQNTAIRNKTNTTCQEKYGGNAPICSEEVQRKIQQTMLKKHGVKHPSQSEEIRNKILSSFQFNGTGPSSRAQRYINYILNGTLNKRICGSLADIYIEKENIVIEHDGAGHFLTDKFNGNKTPTKESLLYEKEREDKIINNGYRMIRFIATKDRIPSDEVILNLVEGFKNSDFKVIRINFEEGTIDRDYEERWYCNFGELRKITKKDLEKFEKQEENTSEN